MIWDAKNSVGKINIGADKDTAVVDKAIALENSCLELSTNHSTVVDSNNYLNNDGSLDYFFCYN